MKKYFAFLFLSIFLTSFFLLPLNIFAGQVFEVPEAVPQTIECKNYIEQNNDLKNKLNECLQSNSSNIALLQQKDLELEDLNKKLKGLTAELSRKNNELKKKEAQIQSLQDQINQLKDAANFWQRLLKTIFPIFALLIALILLSRLYLGRTKTYYLTNRPHQAKVSSIASIFFLVLAIIALIYFLIWVFRLLH